MVFFGPRIAPREGLRGGLSASPVPAAAAPHFLASLSFATLKMHPLSRPGRCSAFPLRLAFAYTLPTGNCCLPSHNLPTPEFPRKGFHWEYIDIAFEAAGFSFGTDENFLGLEISAHIYAFRSSCGTGEVKTAGKPPRLRRNVRCYCRIV